MHSDHPEQSGAAIVLIVILALVIALGVGAVLMVWMLSHETPAHLSSLPGAGASSLGGSLPPPAQAAI